MSEQKKKTPREPERDASQRRPPPDPEADEAPVAEPPSDKPKAEGDTGLDGFK
ncbi:MAG TPA: hypothetical protein VFF06_26465 [Polyangia bacterium]|nr:hypothetical protein [Polyangia bacterium]